MKKIAILITTLIAMLIYIQPVLANGLFSIYPSYKHGENARWIILNLETGKSKEDFITLENLSEQKQTLNVFFREASEENNQFITKENEQFKDLGLWLKIPQNTYELTPHQKIKIPVMISIDQKAPAQKYAGVIYASSETTNNQNLKIVTRIGVRVYMNVTKPSEMTSNFIENILTQNFLIVFSLIAVAASIFYNIIFFIETNKYAKKRF